MIWGYKVFAISFLSLHSHFTIIFAVKFFKYSYINLPGTYILKLALILMGFSYIGTLALGPLSVNGLKGSIYYSSAIYFYMHFQYNGFFLLTVVGLILNFWKKININIVISKNQINLFLLILNLNIINLFEKSKYNLSVSIWNSQLNNKRI